MKVAVKIALGVVAIGLILWVFNRSLPDRDKTISVPDDDPQMAAAIGNARKTIPELLEAIKTGVDSFSVKVAIPYSNGTEHFWLSGVTYSNGTFTGKIDNDPNFVKSVTLGQEYSVRQEVISDWLYVRGGKVTGNYTLRVLLPLMSPREAAEAKKAMGWD